MSAVVRVAAASWPIEAPADEAAWAARLGRWFESAAAGGASLLVFPEYGAMELAALAGPAAAGDLAASLDAVADRLSFADEVHEALCREHGVHAAAASGPCRVEDGAGAARFVNRVRLFGPDGPIGHQDKIVMTRFEREAWNVTGGADGVSVFDTAVGRLGVLTCYDAEFPPLGRALVEAGAEILLVPSCTDALRGFHRVRVGARARALEGQCAAVQSVTVGDAPWCPAVDENRGAAGAFGPPEVGFPEDGVLASGEMDVPGWTFADVDLGAIGRARGDGTVLNVRHWADAHAGLGRARGGIGGRARATAGDAEPGGPGPVPEPPL